MTLSDENTFIPKTKEELRKALCLWGQNISEFYKEVAKICSILKLDYFHIPSFDSSHYWEKDAHYNKKGAKKAASFIYKSVLQD